MAKQTMMIRVLVEVDDDPTTESALLAGLRKECEFSRASKMWIAIDYPRPQDAENLWQTILQQDQDPNVAGRSAMLPKGQIPS